MTPDPARSRFILLTVLRVSGIALMLCGMGVMVKGMMQQSDLIGGMLFALGFVEGLILPRMLARRWRTPPGS
jgi:hypothetical protein